MGRRLKEGIKGCDDKGGSKAMMGKEKKMPSSFSSKCTLKNSKILVEIGGASNNYLSSHRPSLSTHKNQSMVTPCAKVRSIALS